MTDIGQAVIGRAQADGSWSQLDEVDALIVSPDLQAALEAAPEAMAAYDVLCESAKKLHLWSIYPAKRPATRASRIEATIRALSSESSQGLTEPTRTHPHRQTPTPQST